MRHLTSKSWIQQTVDECDSKTDPFSEEMAEYLKQLKKSQKDPLGHPDNDY